MKFKQEQLSSFPPDSNPYLHDLSNMGQDFAKDIHFMFPNHSFEEFKYLIVINTKTGERVKLTIEEDRAPCQVDWKEYLIQKGFDMMEKEIDKLCDECYKLR